MPKDLQQASANGRVRCEAASQKNGVNPIIVVDIGLIYWLTVDNGGKRIPPHYSILPTLVGPGIQTGWVFISGVATNHFSYCRYSMINTDCVWFICRINTTLSVVSKRGYSNLIGGLEHVLFFHRLGISSSQLTNSYFSEG